MENPERVTYFAATDARGKHIPFGIKSKDRDRHMYVIGKTGMGKSTLLENMAIQDLRNGEGLAFIDPHGSTVEHLLNFIPEERIKDVVYFAPFDLEHPIAFNVMQDVGYDKRHLVVSGLMATFKKIWEDSWSARMEYILTNTLLALLEYPDATLLGVNRMYTDKDYRTKVVDNVKDPVVKDFWTKEFANYGDRYTQEATPAIQNKVGQFTGNPLIRNIIGQSKSTFDIRTMMDEKKILLINLSKGLVGETNMRLLGSMLTTRIFLAAMSRADLQAPDLKKLPNFYFYVDEFQNFANETFAEILSEARKYKLNLVIANQYIQQMEEEVRDAVFGNVGTTAVFRVGPFDAEVLETIFMPRFTKEDVVSLDKRQIYLTLMIDGVGSPPFSAVTIPPIEPPPVSFREQVIESSRKQFAVPRAGIEAAIIQELETSAASEAPLDARMKKKPFRPAARSSTPYPPRPSGDFSKPFSPRPAQESPRQEFTQPQYPAASPSSPLPPEEPQQAPRQEFVPQRPPARPMTERPSFTRPPQELSRETFTPREPSATRSEPISQQRELPQEFQRREQQSEPARTFSPRPPQDTKREFTPRPVQQRPNPPAKSAEDLKAILRSMAAKSTADKQQKQGQNQQALKGTLSTVIEKHKPEPSPAPVHTPPPSVVAPPVSSTPPISAPPTPPMPHTPPLPPPPGKQPFEVSEDALRKVLKGES